MNKFTFTLSSCALLVAAALPSAAFAQTGQPQIQNSFAMADKADNKQLVLDTPDQSGGRYGEKCFPGTNTCIALVFQRGPIDCPDNADSLLLCEGRPEVRGSSDKLPLQIRIYPDGDTEFNAFIPANIGADVDAEARDPVEIWELVTFLEGSKPASADGVIIGIISTHLDYSSREAPETITISKRLHVFQIGGLDNDMSTGAKKLFTMPYGKTLCDAKPVKSYNSIAEYECTEVLEGSLAMVTLDEDNNTSRPVFNLFMGGNKTGAPFGPENDKLASDADLIGNDHIAEDMCFFVRKIAYDPKTKSYELEKALPTCKYTDDVKNN